MVRRRRDDPGAAHEPGADRDGPRRLRHRVPQRAPRVRRPRRSSRSPPSRTSCRTTTCGTWSRSAETRAASLRNVTEPDETGGDHAPPTPLLPRPADGHRRLRDRPVPAGHGVRRLRAELRAVGRARRPRAVPLHARAGGPDLPARCRTRSGSSASCSSSRRSSSSWRSSPCPQATADGVLDAVVCVILMTALVVILDRILRRTAVTVQSLAGALSAYLIIGMFFASLFGVHGRAHARSVLRLRRGGERALVPVLLLHDPDHARVRRLHRGRCSPVAASRRSRRSSARCSSPSWSPGWSPRSTAARRRVLPERTDD